MGLAKNKRQQKIGPFSQSLALFIICVSLWSAISSYVFLENHRDINVDTSGGHDINHQDGNCCGPWNCAYYNKKDLLDPPIATLTLEHLASDWQQEPAWNYDGVPILNYTKSNFYIKCHTTKDFQRGTSIKFMPYVNADYLRVVVNKQTIYHNENNLRLVPDNLIDMGVLHFNSTSTNTNVEVVIGVTKVQRSWFMFSWSRIHSSHLHNNNTLHNDVGRGEADHAFSDIEKIGCGTTPICHGDRAHCPMMEKQGLGSGESPWGLCKSFIPTNSRTRCIVYSFGIRDIYTAELLYGRNGCEVYAFDCTVNHPEQLGPNVTFKPWWYVHISACPDLFSNDSANNNNQTSMSCASLSLYVNSLGSGTAELKLDGKLSNAMQHASQNSNFMSLPQIIKRLGHESSELTILKMDCEVSWHCIYFLAFFFCS